MKKALIAAAIGGFIVADAAVIEGSVGGGVFHINVPRNDIHVAAMGAAIPGYMGMNTPLNFQLDGKNAAINGDFILHPAEVQSSYQDPAGQRHRDRVGAQSYAG